MNIVSRLAVLALPCFVLSCGGDTQPPRDPVVPIGSTPPARPSGPVQTNPPPVVPPVVTAGTGGGGGGTGGTGGSAPRPPDARPADAPGASDAAPVAACTMTVTAAGNTGLIDDFQDGNATILGNDGRDGTWVTYKSAATTLTNVMTEGVPELPATGGVNNGRALRMRGMSTDPADSYGAEAQITFSGDPGFCYDASAYDGLQLSIKGLAGTRVYVQLLTASVRAQNAATPDAPVGGHYRFLVSFTNNQIQTVMIPWASFQPGWGTSPGPNVDPKLVYGLTIVTAPRAAPSTAGIGTFDFTVDNVRFIQ